MAGPEKSARKYTGTYTLTEPESHRRRGCVLRTRELVRWLLNRFDRTLSAQIYRQRKISACQASQSGARYVVAAQGQEPRKQRLCTVQQHEPQICRPAQAGDYRIKCSPALFEVGG